MVASSAVTAAFLMATETVSGMFVAQRDAATDCIVTRRCCRSSGSPMSSVATTPGGCSPTMSYEGSMNVVSSRDEIASASSRWSGRSCSNVSTPPLAASSRRRPVLSFTRSARSRVIEPTSIRGGGTSTRSLSLRGVASPNLASMIVVPPKVPQRSFFACFDQSPGVIAVSPAIDMILSCSHTSCSFVTAFGKNRAPPYWHSEPTTARGTRVVAVYSECTKSNVFGQRVSGSLVSVLWPLHLRQYFFVPTEGSIPAASAIVAAWTCERPPMKFLGAPPGAGTPPGAPESAP